MTTQHTPGPWSFRKNYNGSLDFFSEDGARVIMCNARLLNQDANAGLIAAAPDLLEAAQTVDAASEECLDHDGFTAILLPLDAYHKLTEAIAKATGGAA